jgi:hypothetical protein
LEEQHQKSFSHISFMVGFLFGGGAFESKKGRQG